MPTDASSVAISLNMQHEHGGAAALGHPPELYDAPQQFLFLHERIRVLSASSSPSTASNRLSNHRAYGLRKADVGEAALTSTARARQTTEQSGATKSFDSVTDELFGLSSQRVTRVLDAYCPMRRAAKTGTLCDGHRLGADPLKRTRYHSKLELWSSCGACEDFPGSSWQNAPAARAARMRSSESLPD